MPKKNEREQSLEALHSSVKVGELHLESNELSIRELCELVKYLLADKNILSYLQTAKNDKLIPRMVGGSAEE